MADDENFIHRRQAPVSTMTQQQALLPLLRDPGNSANCVIAAEHFQSLGENTASLAWAVRAAIAFGDVATLVRFYGRSAAHLAGQGDAHGAHALLRRAVSLQPDFFDGLADLAMIAVAQGKHDSAETSMRRALTVFPQHEVALLWLGTLLVDRGKFPDAVQNSRAVVASAPHATRAYLNLAASQIGLIERNGALWAARRAIRISPADAKSYCNLAISLQLNGDIIGAARHCRLSIVLQPNLAESWGELSKVNVILGDLSAADYQIRRALLLSPGKPQFHLALASLPSFGDTEDDWSLIRPIDFHHGVSTTRNKAYSFFALSKAYQKKGETDKSFEYLIHANAIIRDSIDYDEKASIDLLKIFQNFFDREYIETHSGTGVPDASPIFVVGMPRSGTSLVEQILARHSRVFGAGESLHFPTALYERLGHKAPQLSNALGCLNGDDYDQLGMDYLKKMRKLSSDAWRITDKLPANLRNVGFIHLALPNAKIIYVKRNPLENCLSCFETLFLEGNEYSYNLGELGRYYEASRKLGDHWSDVLPSGRVLTIHYERLVGDFDTEVSRLLDFCELEWEESCRTFYDSRRPVTTASAVQVRQKLYRTALSKPRPRLQLLAPLLESLGVPRL